VTDTTTIALAGILTSGVVGPGFAAAWQRLSQRRQFRHEHSLKQYEDLRTLLDDAAQVLGAGITNLRVFQEGSGDITPEQLHEWSSKVHLTRERLLLRLPADSSVVRAYTDARAKLTDLSSVIDVEGDDPRRGAAETGFVDARDAFLTVAQQHLNADTAGERRPITSASEREQLTS
jgi:hypothetical protein